MPICLDEATSKKTFGHFARMLIDLDLKSQLRNKMIEKDGYSFFATVEYERLPEFCTHCQIIGHSLVNCFKAKGKEMKLDDTIKPARFMFLRLPRVLGK